ncbi:excisionase family DNA-binding protein [Mycobacteroides chelonae]|uniref:Helix-turn-helix domain-containing protein n=1 Tax=Mycobacteroides chelonae TaxID=1774 RepID=A0AB73U6Q2_MYCCH|nr:excisionase family DNA-binding protein [Mycobacteroides chelonae]MEC4842600.1 excisionase family DNA-binding protein [Mycobacteroides chelonae]MEC4847441.1 excisionase family DNA-binding protein [Mycobacteroides chelonae]QDF71923.1 helix-turn-helix domain-containing protein [Mycobacteroides chelonae]WED90800.1 excisionase family DNA-binding protein [Mycobacteroides chelonae]WED95741.1 excisionase family DNA-binding protein [Mycobacteroides chelonae]
MNHDEISITTAASRLGVNRATVWRWIKNGQLAAKRVGPKIIRVNTADVDRLVTPA